MGARKSWAQENQEDRAPLAQGNREQRAAGNWEHWAATAPGSRSTGELGALDRCSTRELGAPGSPSGTGASCQARHRLWGPAPGHGVDFKMKTIEVDGIKVRIQIWDTAGQERYQTITKQYYRRAQGIFLVYDISSERSYQHIVKWASDVDEYAPDGVQKILIGNKADEEHKRQVPKEQGLQSFTRLTELVLQAHRKELDELRGLPCAPTLARLEEDEQQPLGSEDTPKTCWC
ncbi:ras-related protein Rab-15 isoform X2 [Corvus hawaiiensis]|uniref:ras-related protein Rab-15 isoform X2 n=1 Tax=Corvus kubaryi TaxID=68294 RepID=UPI001C056E2C|nr:ras-related protein Rab-15 isoform X2 [Corvus kubaryi]XP_048161611.1 ras-related protein Rab-15 isoform X2 [Corvus hawaiiensis]